MIENETESFEFECDKLIGRLDLMLKNIESSKKQDSSNKLKDLLSPKRKSQEQFFKE